jgi:fibronectin type 3 domain-containing protein
LHTQLSRFAGFSGSTMSTFAPSASLRASCLLLAAVVLVGCAASVSTSGNGDGKAAIPATPAGLSASPGNAQVTLSWAASSGASSYHVKRSAVSGGPYTQVGAPSGASYVDASVTNGTKYFYVVSAVNSAGESANSAEASGTPTAPASAPASPTNLQATAGNAQVSLSWSGSTSATSYNVKRSTTSGGPYTKLSSPTATSYVDTGLTNGTKYFYVVSAVNSSGESANSSEVSATPTTPASAPAAPANLQATAGNAQVSLTWSASTGATSYDVERSTTSGGPYAQIGTSSTNSYTDFGLTNGTTYYYVVSAVNSVGQSANSAQATVTPAAPAKPDVTITIDPANTHLISPYIYGINFCSGIGGAPPNLTFDRAGGDRWTAYNWETNASNAGSDYLYENDDYLSSSTVPAEAVRSFIAGDQADGMASLVTFQMQGLVAGDENGPVSVANPPDLSRFKQVVFMKSTQSSAPFTLNPPTTDNYVYADEFIWALDQKFSGQSIFGTNPTTHPVFAQLDNEPELWNSTHLEVQGPNPVTSDNYISKTIALTEALKDQFPDVVIFGPVHYGFEGIYNWQGELSATPTGNNWFPDKYLPAIKTAATTYGRPLVDVYDFHWYSEATDGSGNRVTNLTGSTLTDAQVQAIVQSPRSLWDTTYTENSWITTDVLGGPIYILGRLQSRIATENSGMKISITEYNNGGGQHIAGTIAQADNLGVFGVQNLFAANLWPLNSTSPYILAGFRAFRDFDNANSNFGDTSLQATSSNVANVVVYASTDSSTPGRVVFVAINRSTSSQVTAVNGQALFGTAHLFQMTATTSQSQSPIQPVAVGTQPASGTSLTVTLPPLSVTTIDIH